MNRFIPALGLAVATILFSSCKKSEVKKSFLKRDLHEQTANVRFFHHMTYDELKAEKTNLVKAKNYTIALQCLTEMIKKCDQPDELRDLRLERADTLFYVGNYDEAAQEYQQYMQFYPSSVRTPYAEYQSINAMCKRVLTPDRDQEKTEDVVKASTEFAKKRNLPAYQPYVPQVEALAYRCVRRLFESEVLRFYFYLNRSQSSAAQGRLDYITQHYLKLLPDAQAEFMELEYELALARNEQKAAKKKLAALHKQFPAYVLHPERKRRYAAIF